MSPETRAKKDKCTLVVTTDAGKLRIQVAAERPSHHAFELAAQRTFQIETIWPD
jgi:hypothetical protein